MTQLAVGSSITLPLRDGGILSVATNGGFATVVATPTVGAVVTTPIGPLPFRGQFGPYAEGASVVLTNTSAPSLDYDTAGSSQVFELTAVQAQALPAQVQGAISTAQPYRFGSFGDSRCRLQTTGTQIGNVGSAAAFASNRVPAWICAYLGDTEPVADFGVSGDTLISSSSTTGWNGPTRVNSKTIANFIALGVEVCYVQYGINDLPTATSANLIAAAQSMVSELMAAGIKVCVSNIMLFDPTAATPNITPGNAAATLVKINAFRDFMSAWVVTMSGRAVFVDPNPLIALPSTGYGDPQFFTTADTLGVHPNKRGSQVMGQQAAAAIRTLLPRRDAKRYTAGPLASANLIDWGAASTANLVVVNSVAGTTTANTPTWNIDAATGAPYAEATITPTVLASGTAQARFEIWATGVAGATPTWPILAGDVLQGSARVTMDDGSGGPINVQSVTLRHRMFNTGAASQFFTDWGGVAGSTDLTTQPLAIDGRFTTPAVVSPIASASIQTPQAGGGYYLAVFVETPTLTPIRVRIYAPSLYVVSRAQGVSVTAGASPYVWQNGPQPFVLNDWVNTTSRSVMLYISPGAGGTITQIAHFRAPTSAGSPVGSSNLMASGVALDRGFMSVLLAPGDGVVVTWATTAAVLVPVTL